MRSIVIVGAGGLAREVRAGIADINRHRPQFRFAGYAVSDRTQMGKYASRDAPIDDFDSLATRGDVDCLALGIGTPGARLKVAAELCERLPKCAWPALIHPTVVIDQASAAVGRGVYVGAGTIATVSIVLREFALINLSCTIGHETIVGAGCVVNPGVNLSGGVQLGDGVLVGTGAQVLQYVEVGAGATVGAGAVVTKSVEPGATVVGIPARVRG